MTGTRCWIHWRGHFWNQRALDLTPPARYCRYWYFKLGQLCRAQHDVEPLRRRGTGGSSRTQPVSSGWRRGLFLINFHHHTTHLGRRRCRSRNRHLALLSPFYWTRHTTRATSLARVWRLLWCRHSTSSLLRRRVATGTCFSSVGCASFARRVWSTLIFYFDRPRYVSF